jgi:hypothetical protein
MAAYRGTEGRKKATERIAELDRELKELENGAQQRALAAEAAADKLNETKAQLEGNKRDVLENRNTALNVERSTKLKESSLDRFRQSAAETQPLIDASERSKALRESGLGPRQQRDREDYEAQRRSLHSQGYNDTYINHFLPRPDAAVAAAQELGQATQAGFQQIADKLKQHADAIRAIGSRVSTADSVYRYNQ